ncbi:MAG: OmpA family protein [Candidatus Goldbacteria bacterium]|nr:OmpA family protein [Candidatus Goldiibacteriota bacterium]
MNKKKVLLYFLFCIFWVRVNLHAYNPVFLRISPFARPVGMAEAFTSISTGTYGLYYNPAGMASVFNHEIQGSYSLWMQKVNSGNVSGIFTEPLFGKVKIGGSYSYSEISRDDGQNYSPVDWSTYDDGVQKITNNKFNFGAAIELFDLLSIGLCYKYNLSGVGNEKFNNSTLDMGIIANFFMRDQILKLGFLASGTGNKLITNDVDFFLPPNYLIGISDEILMNWTNFMISADVTFTPDLIALFKIGGELILFNNVFLRAGYKIGAFNHLTFGAGLKMSRFELNYAFEEYENYNPSHVISLLINFGTPVIDLKVSPVSFSPNNDGIMDKITIIPEIREPARVVRTQFKIYDRDKNLLLTIPLKNKSTKAIEWDGRIGDKKIIDGEYFISIAAEYDKSGWAESSKKGIKIDTTAPEVRIEAEPCMTRPGKKKALLKPVTFHFFVNDLSGIDKCEFRIWNRNKKKIFTVSWQGEPPDSFVWDGNDDKGKCFDTGEPFFYNLVAYDVYGNKTETKPAEDMLISREIKIVNHTYAVFDKSKSYVKTSAYRELKKLKDSLLRYPDADIVITGHTDSMEDTGKYKTREELSLARAKALKFYLRDVLGFKKRYIIVEGYGDTIPIADNKTEEGRRKNRRVEVTIRAVVYK